MNDFIYGEASVAGDYRPETFLDTARFLRRLAALSRLAREGSPSPSAAPSAHTPDEEQLAAALFDWQVDYARWTQQDRAGSSGHTSIVTRSVQTWAGGGGCQYAMIRLGYPGEPAVMNGGGWVTGRADGGAGAGASGRDGRHRRLRRFPGAAAAPGSVLPRGRPTAVNPPGFGRCSPPCHLISTLLNGRHCPGCMQLSTPAVGMICTDCHICFGISCILGHMNLLSRLRSEVIGVLEVLSAEICLIPQCRHHCMMQ